MSPRSSERTLKAPAFERFLEESSFIRTYLWKYRKWVGIGLLALFLVDLLEAFPPLFLKTAVDVATEHRPIHLLAWVALGYVGVSCLQGLGRYGWRMYLIRAGIFAGRDIRAGYARHVFGLSSSFFDRRRIGDLMSLATSDVDAVRLAIGSGILVMADSLIYFLTIPVVMYLLSPRLTLLAFLPLPVIPWLVMRNEREIHVRFKKVQECFGKLSAMAQENLNGVRVIKAFAREDVQLERFAEVGREFVKLNLRLARIQTSFGPTLDFTMSLGLVALLYFGGGELVRQPAGAVTLGTFVAFQRYIQKMVWPMAAFGMGISFYQRSVTSGNRIKEVLGVSSDVPSPANPVLPAGFEPGGRTAGKVEFRNLRFGFPGSADTLDGISLTIEPGERIAFIGAIGSGKSALLSLLPRLYPVERGMILVDGVDINDWPLDELRRQVGYVGQEVFLFSQSVTENVAFGLHQWVSGAGAVERAAELAAVHDEVLGLSDAYGTRLGERGVNLSGGQKQRLTIARALAKQPSILVLDDALSSVDVNTEERILRGLRQREGRNTELIAAHRISTVRDADRIVVLEAGKIRQVGTHEELLADRRGTYRSFYEQQRLKEDLETYAEQLEGRHEL